MPSPALPLFPASIVSWLQEYNGSFTDFHLPSSLPSSHSPVAWPTPFLHVCPHTGLLQPHFNRPVSGLTSGPFHWQWPLPRSFFPQLFVLPIVSLRSLFKYLAPPNPQEPFLIAPPTLLPHPSYFLHSSCHDVKLHYLFICAHVSSVLFRGV